MTVSVCTLVHGRLDHLAAQARSLAEHAPDAEHVVAWMGGPDPRPVVPNAVVVRCGDDGDAGALPLAAARNAAARAARGDALLLLDVDCLVEAGAVAELASAVSGDRRLVAMPRVLYAPGLEEHPGRPASGDPAWELLWTVGVALSRAAFDAADGFDEAYAGYGAEDTDFAFRCRAAGLRLRWQPAASVVHLHHDGSGELPVDRAAAIVMNALVFHARWGTWPMTTWIDAFLQRGLLEPNALAQLRAAGYPGVEGAAGDSTSRGQN